MDPRYNWSPQAYQNGQYNPHAPQQLAPNGYHPQQQQPQQLPHQQNYGYAPQYPPMQPHMHQGLPQQQQQRLHPQHMMPQSTPQQYAPMPQAYPPQQHQTQPQMQQQVPPQVPAQMQPRQHPQVVIPARAPAYPSPMQYMQPPKIRHVQMPVNGSVQRPSNAGFPQLDGAQDRRPQNTQQQTLTPSASKPVQRSQSHSSQENTPRPQQRPANPPLQNQSQHRAPLQAQSTPQSQRPPSTPNTATSQHQSSSTQPTPTPTKKLHPQVVIPRSSTHHLTPTKHAPTMPRALPVDLSVMLLSAADEYIIAARAMGNSIARDTKENDLSQYRRLMSTGMGCMHAVLRDFSMAPRDEAKLRFRYASLLIEETDNTTEIDEVISKQIALCGRSRLNDLKYASMHLQARYQFKTNHRAALKALEKPIEEAETFEHIAWVYAFRFLKVSLTLQVPGKVESVPALQQLHAILAHAERRNDRAIYVACNTFEAMVHLRSSTADRLEQAQRAIAAARSLQLQVSTKQLGSFGTLIDLIDIACGIQCGAPNVQKSNAVIQSMLDPKDDLSRSETGVFTVLIERSFGGGLTFDTGGIFKKNPDGKDELVFDWLPSESLKTLCFHMGALDQNLHGKGFSYIKEAHQRSRALLKARSQHGVPATVATARLDWIKLLDWHSMFTYGLIASFREEHAIAGEVLSVLKKKIPRSPSGVEAVYPSSLHYLTAVIEQKKGCLSYANSLYCSEHLHLPSKSSASQAKFETSILAALNRLLIIRDPAHIEHGEVVALLAQLQAFCENHPNQYIRTAYRLVNAMSTPESSINRQKTLMQGAVNAAHAIFRSTQNRELVIMALSYFTMAFFVDQMGEKAIQAVRATRQNSQMQPNPIWKAVASGLCMQTYQRHGLVTEAQTCQQEFEQVRHQLPLALSGGNDDDAEGEEDADGDVQM